MSLVKSRAKLSLIVVNMTSANMMIAIIAIVMPVRNGAVAGYATAVCTTGRSRPKSTPTPRSSSTNTSRLTITMITPTVTIAAPERKNSSGPPSTSKPSTPSWNHLPASQKNSTTPLVMVCANRPGVG